MSKNLLVYLLCLPWMRNKKKTNKKKKSAFFTHLPEECTRWQGCCKHPGRLQCRQPPGSGTVSRWSDLSADSSWSLGCWCSSPDSPLAAPPDGTYRHTHTHTLVNRLICMKTSEKSRQVSRSKRKQNNVSHFQQKPVRKICNTTKSILKNTSFMTFHISSSSVVWLLYKPECTHWHKPTKM